MSLYCTFFVERFFIGIPVSQIQEVIRHQEMSRVPLARPEVRGLINLRGQIVTAVDLRLRLGLANLAGKQSQMNVLVSTPDGAVSLLVDQIEDVIEVSPELIELPPETLQGELRKLICGACKLKDRLLLLLDTERAVEFN